MNIFSHMKGEVTKIEGDRVHLLYSGSIDIDLGMEEIEKIKKIKNDPNRGMYETLRSFTGEKKLQIIKEGITARPQRKMSQIANKYNIDRKTLRKWIKQYEVNNV